MNFTDRFLLETSYWMRPLVATRAALAATRLDETSGVLASSMVPAAARTAIIDVVRLQ